MNLTKNDKGSTLVEVLVAFTVMMILVASFVKVIDLASNLFYSAKELEFEESAINSVIYRDTVPTNGEILVGDYENPRVYAFVDDTVLVSFVLNETKTSVSAYTGKDRNYAFNGGRTKLVSYVGNREGTLIYRFR